MSPRYSTHRIVYRFCPSPYVKRQHYKQALPVIEQKSDVVWPSRRCCGSRKKFRCGSPERDDSGHLDRVEKWQTSAKDAYWRSSLDLFDISVRAGRHHECIHGICSATHCIGIASSARSELPACQPTFCNAPHRYRSWCVVRFGNAAEANAADA
jgi:hypothetical protein